MLPEVENYITVLRTSQEEYTKKHHELRFGSDGSSDDLYYNDREKYRIEETKLTEKREEEIKAAWDALKTSDNAIVRFIANNCAKYSEGEAKEALMLLPCSVETVKQVAKDRGWCAAFDTYVEEATDAGLIGGVAYTKEQISLRKHLRSLGVRGDLDEIQTLVDTIVATEIIRATESVEA